MNEMHNSLEILSILPHQEGPVLSIAKNLPFWKKIKLGKKIGMVTIPDYPSLVKHSPWIPQ